MNHSRNDTSKTVMLAAASALVILLAGCQSAVPTSPVTYISDTMPTQTEMVHAPDSPQKTYSEQINDELFTEEPHANSVDTTSDTNAETSTVRKTDDTKATVKTESQDAVWLAAAPMLRGIAIGDSDSTVDQLFGKPLDSYILEEETEKINVLEYDGFAVGINVYKTVQYIEVYGKNISAGLSGLQIGDTPEEALLALGKPEKQTAYLLTYQAKGAMLKLDLDPLQNEIVSIKLLSIT